MKRFRIVLCRPVAISHKGSVGINYARSRTGTQGNQSNREYGPLDDIKASQSVRRVVVIFLAVFVAMVA